MARMSSRHSGPPAGEEQFLSTVATALTLLEDARAPRWHGNYWRRKLTEDSFTIHGYYSTKPTRKSSPPGATPEILLIAHDEILVLFVETAADGNIDIAVYNPGAWEVAFCGLINTAEELIAELLGLNNPVINSALAAAATRLADAPPSAEDIVTGRKLLPARKTKSRKGRNCEHI